MVGNVDKIRHLLPHLLEHNMEHVKEHKRWVELCEESGLKEIAEDLRQVVSHFEACNTYFEDAVAKIQKV